MAYAALVSLAQTIHHILNHHQYSISPHENEKLRFINKYIIFLQAFLEDFPGEANSLEGRIRDVAYEAEDMIECFISEQISSCSAHHGCHLDGLKNVTQEIESIAVELMDIRNNFGTKKARPRHSPATASSSSSRLITTTIKNDDMVGFEDDLIEIKTRLCGESSKLQVIPIVGMGGIGKTTLARNAYDDPLTMQYFDIRLWVTLSQEYSIQEIVSHLVLSMKSSTENQCEQRNQFERNTELMEEYVYKNLKGKRYLIVMDDMWSTKAWDHLKMIFPDDRNGSRIILTTRLSDVAAYADSSSPLHEMRFMDEDQSWNLLRQKVFAHEDCPPELEDTGKAIARSCSGLPLAIVVIAGLLSTVSKTRASWGEIAKKVNSIVATKDGPFAKILSLSYTQLPHHLRPCFLYMGGFPEDYEIHVSKITKLWMAEGFLEPNGSKSIEEVAEEYLEDLVKRSLFLVTKRKSNGKIKSCSVHDLVRDLCIRQAREEKFLRHVRSRCVRKVLRSLTNQRRISVPHSDLHCLANIYGSTIRTIICFVLSGNSLRSLGNFRLLRVLDVLNVEFSSYSTHYLLYPPDELFELFHLRYLALAYPQNIPAAISNLQNLQTLIIHPVGASWSYYERFMVHLPRECWCMPSLRHLVSSTSHALCIPEPAVSALENLQTLYVVKNLRCTPRTLRSIPNLKKLGIIYSSGGCHLENLVYLHRLEKLKLTMFGSFRSQQKLNPAFPRTLRKLTLSGGRLPWEDMTIIASLPNLQVLKLRDFACHGSEWETTDGEFPQLNVLLIDESNLQHWITESSHFPSLKRLSLHRCPNLTEIPGGIGEIPTLELIEVKHGNESLVESAKRIHEEQQNWGNDVLQVRCLQY